MATPTESSTEAQTPDDPELQRIVGDEERCLARIIDHLAERARRKKEPQNQYSDYDAQLLVLRDEIAAARLEDVPPLIEQMERLQSLAARRRLVVEGFVDPRSPYFGHMVLEEQGRRREVLIGRATYLDTASGVRIVDWRDAPVSRLYYRYEEGDDYSEVFGDREVDGEVITRRSVSIADRVLRRVGAPQGTFVKNDAGTWRRIDSDAARLHGGQGSASRAEHHRRPGKLGAMDASASEDKHLKDITALIDRRQFELITHADSGLVVIQGGAGSGKTTIGLHRLAYLAFQDKRRFRPDRMLVVVFNEALARYISQVLPALDVDGVAIRTYEDWASRLRDTHVPHLPRRYNDDTPGDVTRLKKHPAMLRLIEAHVAAFEADLQKALHQLLVERSSSPASTEVLAEWRATAGRAVAHRLHAIKARAESRQGALPTDARVGLERIVKDGLRAAGDVVTHWADVLTDRALVSRVFGEHAPGQFNEGELNRAHAWCSAICGRAAADLEERREARDSSRTDEPRAKPRRPESDTEREPRGDDEDHRSHREGIDGNALEEAARIDREDDTLLLKLYQRLMGPLRRGKQNKEALVYEHVLVDEAQDLSPLELAVVLGTVSKAQCVTLAGDVAQRLHMDNGFTDWQTVLGELGLSHTEVEPLKLSYRSTHEIIDFAREVLGPLAPKEQGQAVRGGAPVEMFTFSDSGDAVAFLAENVRGLLQQEPRASVALIARYPEQADLYFRGLSKAEIPNLRRIAEQDFPFRPGVDVTDVRQVKGLEFDYVVLLEVSDAAYPADDEARHLLHIGATRAAHQLWILSPPRPSPLLPKSLVERSL